MTDALVEAVAELESGGKRDTIGDGGKANGWWQMHEAAWADTSDFRKRSCLTVWDYEHAHSPGIARMYARDYLAMLEARLRNVLGNDVTAEMVYAAYNVGFARFQSFGFCIERTPLTTQSACKRLAQLVAAFEKPISTQCSQ